MYNIGIALATVAGLLVLAAALNTWGTSALHRRRYERVEYRHKRAS